jgi:GNAT superfamily N-acetyltransferase
MAEQERYRIEVLRRDHDRTRFDCGHPFLNEYLRSFARQNDDRGIARAYVLVPESGNPVAGYYTLSAGSVAFESIPAAARKRIPRYPIPVARIGELAVDSVRQGEGLGGVLIYDAFRRIVDVARELALWAVVVDPIDRAAIGFYQHFGFEPLSDSGALFLTLRDIRAWVGRQG